MTTEAVTLARPVSFGTHCSQQPKPAGVTFSKGTAMGETYAELLRRPEWQKKRLEVMQRADFSCENCGDKEKTLNVHHTYYEHGKKPWEYPDESLVCVCEDCHKLLQNIKDRLSCEIHSLDWSEQQEVIGCIIGLKAHRQTDLKFKLIDYSECLGFAAYAGINVDVVVKQMAEVGFVSGEFCDSERAKKNVGEKVEVLS